MVQMEEHTLQLKELKKALMGGKASDIETAVNDCLGAGIDVRVIIKSIQKDMCDVGIQFEKGRIFLPQMLAMAAGIQSAMSILRPMLEKSESSEPKGQVVAIGTVQGDVHDIGKNICVMLFTVSGYEVHDLGRDVPMDDFVKQVEEGATYLGMSSLMTTTMMTLKDVIDELDSRRIRGSTVVMVGGAPVTQAFADKICADIYGETAFETITKMRYWGGGDANPQERKPL